MLHDDDPQKSLAALSSIGSVREELSRIADPDLQASLPHVSAARPNKTTIPNRTIASARSWATRRRPAPAFAFSGRMPREDWARSSSPAIPSSTARSRSRRSRIQFADDPRFRARFEFEAEVTGGLEHPGIVPVYGLGHTSGRPAVLRDAVHQGGQPQGGDPAVPRGGPAAGPRIRASGRWRCASCWDGSSTSATPSPTPTAAACCTAT